MASAPDLTIVSIKARDTRTLGIIIIIIITIIVIMARACLVRLTSPVSIKARETRAVCT